MQWLQLSKDVLSQAGQHRRFLTSLKYLLHIQSNNIKCAYGMRCLFSSSYLISEETIKRNGERGTSTEKGKMKKWEQTGTLELKIEPVTARVRLLAVRLFSYNPSSSTTLHGLGRALRRPCLSRLACLGFACNSFAKKNKRPLAVYCCSSYVLLPFFILPLHLLVSASHSTFSNVFAFPFACCIYDV